MTVNTPFATVDTANSASDPAVFLEVSPNSGLGRNESGKHGVLTAFSHCLERFSYVHVLLYVSVNPVWCEAVSFGNICTGHEQLEPTAQFANWLIQVHISRQI